MIFGNALSELLRLHPASSINVKEIYEMYDDRYPSLTVDLLLFYMQENRIPVYDVYGNPTFVNVVDNVARFQPFFPLKKHY